MQAPFALIVEDNLEMAMLSAAALSESGYQTEIIPTGHKAQARLAFITPDLILLDLHLPYMDGSVILRQVRKQKRLAGTKVIVAASDPHSAAALQDEADFVFVKPLSTEQLRELAIQLKPAPLNM